MTKSGKFLIAALAATAILVAVVPLTASASSSSVSVQTSDANPGGEAYLHRSGSVRDPVTKQLTVRYTLTARDTQADGYGVRAYASYFKSKQNLVKNVSGFGSSKSGSVMAAPGRRVYVQVCLRNHSAGQTHDHFCSAWRSIVAG